MIPDADSGMTVESSPVWDGVKEVVVKNGYDAGCVGEIERTKFYEKAGRAYVTVCTSETKPYAASSCKRACAEARLSNDNQ